jgi:hypothetical protein
MSPLTRRVAIESPPVLRGIDQAVSLTGCRGGRQRIPSRRGALFAGRATARTNDLVLTRTRGAIPGPKSGLAGHSYSIQTRLVQADQHSVLVIESF